MAEDKSGTGKQRGRPKLGATQLSIRLPPDVMKALDDWIAKHPATPGRQEAIRAFITAGLHMMGDSSGSMAKLGSADQHSRTDHHPIATNVMPKNVKAKPSVDAPPIVEDTVHAKEPPKFWTNLKKR